MSAEALRYQSGFGNEFATEALPDALPTGQNSPQRAPYGLYAEQLSGTAFTAPRGANRRSWLYRMRPAAIHQPFVMLDNARILSRFDDVPTPPNQLRWDPLPMPQSATDFVDGLVTMAGNGDVAAMSGCGIHMYTANASMTDRFFYDADGELLIVPQQGRLRFATELGRIDVRAGSAFVSSCSTQPPAATSAKIMVRRCDFRTWGRSARMGSPTPAISWRRTRGMKSRKEISSWLPSSWAIYGPPGSGTRHSMSSPGTAITRPTSTICAGSTRSDRSASIIPTRRSSWFSSRRATRPASTIWISSSFRHAGW